MSSAVRSDLHCHDCGKDFVAKLDLTLDGNHVIICPWCGHQHHRVVKAGIVTSDRHNSSIERVEVPFRSVWKTKGGLETSSISHFLRERWLEKVVG